MAGLTIRSPQTGQTILDLTGNYSQDMGSVDTGAAMKGSVSIPSPPAGKTMFYCILALQDLQREKGHLPAVTLSGNTLSWAYTFAAVWGHFAANCRIAYGYF